MLVSVSLSITVVWSSLRQSHFLFLAAQKNRNASRVAVQIGAIGAIGAHCQPNTQIGVSKMEINTLAAEAESRSVALSRAQSS